MTDQTTFTCVIDFLRTENRIASYLALKQGPYFLAVQGVQGSGKTTLSIAIASDPVDHSQAKQLAETLRASPWCLPTVVVSIDDFYLTNRDQAELARRFPDNPLIQHRGQPSTHDLDLWRQTFESLKQEQRTAIPQYDKSCFDGKGDRLDHEHWQKVNEDAIVKVVIFEGWSVGFHALSEEQIQVKRDSAVQRQRDPSDVYDGQLAYHKLEDLLFINEALRKEEVFCEYFRDLVQIDSYLPNVYKWRLQQEQALRAAKGSGMTDEQVKRFIDGYYSSYELYTEALSRGAWRQFNHPALQERHLRICVDNQRRVQRVAVV